MTEAALSERGAMRVISDSPTGYPCRISLAEAAPGDHLILFNYISHDCAGPFRTAYAIYVREDAELAPCFEDEVPPILARRTLGLRAFDSGGMLRAAALALPGEADAKIRELLGDPEIASIHAHNAAHGCFLAKIERG
ncbi:DUF1203 domain-containing protein [Allosphingosinicella indica]|nr:DUF1203 domain-containing protein [Allosphingosinicella indica]